MRLSNARQALGGAVLTVTTGVVINLVIDDGRWRWSYFIVAVVLALMAGIVTIQRVRANDDGSVPEQVSADLRRRLRAQWQREADNRGLTRPEPLRIPLAYTRRPIVAEVSEILDGSHSDLPPPGDVADLAGLFRQLPFGRLVILGERESGKTSALVLLIAQMLEPQEEDEPVPVLFALPRWNPHQPFDEWLADELSGQFPEVLDRQGAGRALAERLIENGRILPLLDGLDEMGAELRPEALRVLSEESGKRPMVVACTTAEYEQSIATVGLPLPRAAVVELQPVNRRLAARYLPAGQLNAANRWASVVADLKSDDDGPLVQALSTPLMIYLARTAYATVDTDPDALRQFTTRVEVERHLLDAYLPSLYRSDARRRTWFGRKSRGGHPVVRIEAWLGFLARHLQRTEGSDLAWWQLETVTNLAVRFFGGAAILGLVCGLLPVIAIGYLLSGVEIAVVLIVGGLLGAGTGTQLTEPSRGFMSGPPTSDLRQLRAFLKQWGVGSFLACGIGFASALFAGAVSMGGSTPWSLPAQSRLLSFSLVGVLVIGWIFGARVFRERARLRVDGRRSARSAVRVLAVDRWITICESILVACVTGSVVGFFAAGIAAVTPGFPSVGLAFWRGCMVGVGYGLAYALLTRPWGRWLIFVRVPLTLTRRQPVRLLAFLADANRRGVLRQEGAVYQFRHVHLRDYLATAESERPQVRRPDQFR